MSDAKGLAERLRGLDAKATPGPWKYEPGGGHAYNRIVGSDSVQVNGWKERRNGVSNASYSDQIAENFGDTELDGPASNVALICALRNELPAILAALEDAERYRWLRRQNWTQRGLFVVNANAGDVVKLGTDCPSDMRLDAALDSARKAGA